MVVRAGPGLGLLGVLAAAAAPGMAAGAGAPAPLTGGQALPGRFTLQRLYDGAAGEARGARFLHASGLPVDVLIFPSAPRLSIIARTLPVSDKGESHTGEHLLLGKGRTGRFLNTLVEMRLGEYAAETHPELTCYHFRAPVGPSEFFELTRAMLTALLKPDFTDEEIRREVAHVEPVAGPGGKLHLEEKGTVYNEMASRVQDPVSVRWQTIRTLAYGAGHPLAREVGGLPAGIRRLTPAELRRFHAAHYHIGPNMGLVAVIPPDWVLADFLAQLDAALTEVEPEPPRARPVVVPPARPTRTPRIAIGKFPSANRSAPQVAVLAWPPLQRPSLRDEFRITLLLSVLGGGETSLLHRDLVDGKTAVLDTGATAVGTYLDDGPLPIPSLSLAGMRPDSIRLPLLRRLRDTVEKRIRWLSGLPAGNPELAEIARRARSLLSGQRRSVLKSLDDAPGFGDYNAAASWHRYLDTLAREGGARAPLLPEAIFTELLRDLDSGQNLWRPIAQRAGLLGHPHLSAALPDPALLARERKARETRLRAHLRAVKTRFRLRGDDTALARLKKEFDAATGAIEKRNAEVKLPAFLAHPPMARDDAPFAQEKLGTVPVIRTHFDATVFTDVSVAFDLGDIPEGDRELLPLLSSLDSLGVTTRQGEVLDYATTEERVRASVYSVGLGLGFNPRTRRAELYLGGSASSTQEIARLAEWMETFLERPRVDPSVRARLVDVVRGRLQGLRGLFQQDAEDWAGSIANALDYQDDPLYFAASSPFTVLYHLSRLRWRLEDPGPEARAALEGSLAEVAAKLGPGDRVAVARHLAGLHGDLGEQLRFELDHLPPDTWRADLARLVREIRADLASGPDELIGRLRGLLGRIRARGNARVQVTSSSANAGVALRAIDPMLAALPAGEAAHPRKAGPRWVEQRLRERYRDQPIGPHLALVLESATNGGVAVRVPGPDYREPIRDNALDMLALGLFAGAGPSSLFMSTWAAGLAYSNGMYGDLVRGRVGYQAYRCPDPVQTLKFAASFARSVKVEPALVQASLANAFGDYGGASGYAARGARIASDLIDGLAPNLVRAFKTQLLEAARAPGTVEALTARIPALLGRMLVGAGGKVAADKRALALVTGPPSLLDRYEQFLRDSGEATVLPRLYPRDFWPPERQ